MLKMLAGQVRASEDCGTGMLGTGMQVSPPQRVNFGIFGSPCSKGPQSASKQRVATMRTTCALSCAWLWWLQGRARRAVTPDAVLQVSMLSSRHLPKHPMGIGIRGDHPKAFQLPSQQLVSVGPTS